NTNGEWKEVAAKLFRYRVGQWINWSTWPSGTSDDAGIKAEMRAELQIAYPRIKMCDGWTWTPWGKVKYKYPCAVELAYHDLKEVRAWVTVRLKSNGMNQICVEQTDFGTAGKTDVIGFLILMIYEGALVGLLGMFSGLLAHTAAAIFILLDLILLTLETIIALLAQLIPDQVCRDISNFLKVPLIEDRVAAQLSRPLVEMKRTGVTIAIDGDFHRIILP
ncbi:MAG: hypothetical protein JZU55_05470, partial [Afipia sp.]|nr:hypothetical protein [Afipia sp.]